MLDLVDNFLNGITMYKLVLYYLILLLLAAFGLCVLGVLSLNPVSLVISVFFLEAVCYITNSIFAYVFETQTNVESVHITALILALIISPITSLSGLALLFWAGVLAMSSKYILAVGGKHVFNPAAAAVVITALALGQSASWWVGTLWMLPFVLTGVLIVRKIKRLDLVFYFLLTAAVVIGAATLLKGGDPLNSFQRAIVSSPVLFFAFVMLTEPLTTPPTKFLQSAYGVLVGFLFAPQLHFGPLYTTPEIALAVGNVFSYFVSPKEKLVLTLKEKIRLSADVWDFVFTANKRLNFIPGQYMEWTLGHNEVDSRGNRRYFTLASSPTEPELSLGVKFYEPASSFKRSLISLSQGEEIVAAQLAGDFVLPEDENQKLVFLAGGIGITPFRSMIKYLMDKNEKRDIVLIFSNRQAGDIVYKPLFDEACRVLGIKVIYTLTDKERIPADWQGKTGYVDRQMIEAEVPDWRQRKFYISGSHSMVTGFEKTLHSMAVPARQVKVDYFPGFV